MKNVARKPLRATPSEHLEQLPYLGQVLFRTCRLPHPETTGPWARWEQSQYRNRWRRLLRIGLLP